MYPDDWGVEAPKKMDIVAEYFARGKQLRDEHEARLKNDQMQAQAAMQQYQQNIPVHQLPGNPNPPSSGLAGLANMLGGSGIAPGQVYTISGGGGVTTLSSSGTITGGQPQQNVADESKFMVTQAVNLLCDALQHEYAKYDREKVKTAVEGIFEWAKEGGLK